MTEWQDEQDLYGVAIVGMSGRFPGATDIDTFWQNLCNGVESITHFAEQHLDPSLDPDQTKQPNYVKARGIVADADKFDAAFFGFTPKMAEIMDPQQRVCLEVAWSALEDAGYDSENFDGMIGVYAGMANNSYFPSSIFGRADVINRVGEFQAMLANEKDYLATRISHQLNLTGPSVGVYTACSTSLVAVVQAFYSLMSFQCDMALAGGVTITAPQASGYLHQEGGIQSSDGHCRPFDAKAEGTVFGDGVGMVVLKRLEDAVADGDRICAIIRGAAMNNDGATKVSYAAPSVDGQAQVIAMAHAQADINPETISYIEAHGTATHLGDPIEIEALTQAFRDQTDKKQFCAIGSVKSNFGHLIAASGVAGLIKTTLALQHKQLPPTLHFEKPNPQIDFENSPFYVNDTLQAWSADQAPRRAGISSFGIGGTNAHVILEEAPSAKPSGPSRPQQLLMVSAKNEAALDTATANLAEQLQQQPDLSVADTAYTLQTGRRDFKYRRMVVCSDKAEAETLLSSGHPSRLVTRKVTTKEPKLALMFPGQGAQYAQMGLSFYQNEPVYREAIETCTEILKPLINSSLTELLYPAASASVANPLDDAFYAQPAIFSVEYALAKLWASWGIEPQAYIGHSVGENVAACLAGVYSLEDGVRMVVQRAKLTRDMIPTGTMLAIRASAEKLDPLMTGDLGIAAYNGPMLTVTAGPDAQIASLQEQLEKEDVICRKLSSSHAFHSPMVEPVVPPLTEFISNITLSAPIVPVHSTVTETWLTDAQATDPHYWANLVRAPVRFAGSVKQLWQEGYDLMLEVGPGVTTATLARQQMSDRKAQVAISSLGESIADATEWNAILNAIGHLWLNGVSIDWQAFYANEERQRVALPTYPFARKRCWIDPLPHPARTNTPVVNKTHSASTTSSANGHAPQQKSTTVNDTGNGQDKLQAKVLNRTEKRRAALVRKKQLPRGA
ncbi:MAG: type I polyketide synthase [Chloroflexota bacterium]